MKIQKKANFTHYSKKKKEIKKSEKIYSLKKVYINFFSNFTAELLDTCIKAEFANKGYNAVNSFYSYGDVEQKLLENFHFSKTLKNQVFFFHFRTEDFFFDLSTDLINNNKNKLLQLADEKVFLIKNLIKNIRKYNNSNIFISNFSNISLGLYETLENSLPFTQAELINYINNQLRILSRKFFSVYIYDYFSFVNRVGLYNLLDQKMWFMARFPFKSKYNPTLVRSYIKSILSSIETPKKCLICDLDNTLWGGVIGEGNGNSINLGDQFPGNIYKDFQKTISIIKEMGFFLAIVSKNNKNDVLTFIDKNEECILKSKDFAIIKSNWEDKASNILEISKDLNIGLDSIVFFDDSPIEREWVKNQLPQVNVIDVPKNPVYFKDALINSNFFDKNAITLEDRKRPRLYSNEKNRKRFKKNFSNFNDFLKSLKMKIILKKADTNDIPRVAQLVNKVNQFNLTSKRKNEGNLSSLLKTKDCIYTIKLEDKFGDFGVVGVIILNYKEKSIWEIDNYLLSCRALGRKVENISIHYLLNLLKRRNAEKIYGIYIPSKKNIQAKDFYKNVGFAFDKKIKKWVWLFNKKKHHKIDIAEVKYFE